MAAGVTIEMPETVLVDPDVTVGADTVLEPGVQLLGKTRIGAELHHSHRQHPHRCHPRTMASLVKPYCVITASQLAAGAQVGPFAHLRECRAPDESARASAISSK